MSDSVLGSLALGFERMWNPQRRCAGVRLRVAPRIAGAVDARHLLDALGSAWAESTPILLQVQSPALLADLLAQRPVRAIWLEIADDDLMDTATASRVRLAWQRGWPLVWSGPPGLAPAPDTQAWFHKTLHALTPFEALDALHAARSGHLPDGPARSTCLYQDLPSQALVNHALDQQRVWGVVGWPTDDILHANRLRPIQPSHRIIHALLKALERDASFDTLEDHLVEDPLLAYRFLRFANSALVGARGEVSSVRQGLMVMGHTPLRRWLAEQLPNANEDTDLDPIRASMVLRAHLMAHLSDAGAQDELRREVFLCGLLSQLDQLLHEPLGAALQRLPLPGRIASAVVGRTGPYAAWLEVAEALESGNTSLVRTVCQAHAMAPDAVNRALLRALGSV